MSSRLTALLGWVTLAAILAALWIAFGEDPSLEQGGRGERLFPALADKIDDVKRVRIEVGDVRTTLTFGPTDAGIGWTVDERAGYWARTADVNSLIRAVARSTRREPKTMNRDRFPDIGLGEGATLLTLMDEAGIVMAHMQVGDGRSIADDRAIAYVFKEGDSRAWLVSDIRPIEADPQDWLLGGALDWNDADIRSVRYGDVVLSRTVEGGDVAFERADGETAARQFALREPFRTIAGLAFADVADVANPLDEPVADFVFETFSGMRVTYALYERDGGLWVQASAVPLSADNATSREQVQGFNEAVHGWLYRLSDMDAAVFRKSRADFLAPEADSAAEPS